MKAKEFLAAAAAVMIAAVGSGSVLMSLTAMDTEAASTSKPATLTTNSKGTTCFRTEGADRLVVEVSGVAGASCSGLIGWYTDEWHEVKWDTNGLNSSGTGTFTVDLSGVPEDKDIELQTNYYAKWDNSKQEMVNISGTPTFTSVTLYFGSDDGTTTTPAVTAPVVDPTWSAHSITPGKEYDYSTMPDDDKMIGWKWSEFGLQEGELVKRVDVKISVPSGTIGKWSGGFGSSTTVKPDYWTMEEMEDTYSTQSAIISWTVPAATAETFQTQGNYSYLKFGTFYTANGSVFSVDSVTVYTDPSTIVTTTTTAATTTTTTTTTTVDPSKAMIGDVTQNGKVNLSDVVMLQKYLMGSYDLSDAQMKLADVTEDGNVRADDVTALMKSLLKITK